MKRCAYTTSGFYNISRFKYDYVMMCIIYLHYSNICINKCDNILINKLYY